MFKLIADYVSNKLIEELNYNRYLQSKLVGNTGPMGECGPGADILYKQWKEKQNRPHATVEEFLYWFKMKLEE